MATKKALTKTEATDNRRFRDRIKEFRRIPAKELRRNPKNWRVHEPEQKRAMEGILEEVGFAGAAVAFINENGEIQLVDGHLRADLSDTEEVPVLITDLNEQEADKVLATYDPIGMMAGTDGLMLDGLLQEISFDSHDVEQMIEDLAAEHRPDEEIPASDADFAALNDKAAKAKLIPEMELTPEEHYDYVIVLARSRTDWNRLCAVLELEKTRKPMTNKIGLGRGVDAKKLLELLDKKNAS